MGLAEDTVRLVSSCLRQFEKITNSTGGSFNSNRLLRRVRHKRQGKPQAMRTCKKTESAVTVGQLGWYVIPCYCQGTSKPSEEDNCQKPWLTLFENQLPNLCEVQ
jgi:hypothetical protein